jgi:hypothetical protein
MSEIVVREARLDDCAAITAIHLSHITRWQRLDAQGQVQDVPYEGLTVYERWLHGGPWMSLEMCAIHVNHLLRGAGIPLVAEIDGRVLAEAEVFHGVESPPYGDHLHLALLCTHRDQGEAGLDDALLDDVLRLGQERECGQVSVAALEDEAFYHQRGFRHLASGRGMSFAAREGQVFYQATPHPAADPAQIRGWQMPLGRQQSAHQHWVTLWPNLWASVPELRQQRVERLKFNVAGNAFFALYGESRYDPRRANLYVWTPTPLTGPMLTAISDKAHKLGFRRLETFVMGDGVDLRSLDAEPDGHTQNLYGIDL